MKSFTIFILLVSVLFLANCQQWVLVDRSEIDNNPLIKDLLHFGLDLLIEEGQNEDLIPDRDLVLSEIESVEVSSGCDLSYKFEVIMSNERGATLTAIYIVNYFPETGEKVLNEEYQGYEYEAPYSE